LRKKVYPGNLAGGFPDLEMTWLLYCAGAATEYKANFVYLCIQISSYDFPTLPSSSWSLRWRRPLSNTPILQR